MPGERLLRQMLTAIPTSTGAAAAPTRDEALWAEEVSHVLASLADDSMLDHASRRNAGTMLTALNRPALRVV